MTINTMDFTNKTHDELSLNELAWIHLSQNDSIKLKNGYLLSGLPILLREIRHCQCNEHSKNFMPLIGAFSVLDQIGFCYSRSNMPEYNDGSNNASSIKKSLYYFCDFQQNDKDTKALFSLRNSLLHNASLLSKAQYSNQPNHCFIFDRTLTSIVQHPVIEWNGVFLDFKSNMETLVNPEKIIEIANRAVSNAFNCLKSNTLKIELKDGEMELYYRFLKFNPINRDG